MSIEAVLALGSLDQKLIEARRRLREASRLASPQENRVRDARANLEQVAEQTRRAKLEVQRLEGDLKAKQEEIAKHQVALNSATSNEEYQGLLRNIERGKQEVGDLETRVLENYEAADEREAERQRTEQRLREQEAELEKARELVATEEAKHREEIERLEGEREARLAEISPQHLDLYQRILEKHDDSAVAEVSDEICQGCYMRVRPEQVSKIRGRAEVVTCTSCGRILFGTFD